MTHSRHEAHEYGERLEALRSELHARLRRRLGADRAEDVVQEAFLFSLRRPPPEASGLPSWLRVIARSLVIRHRLREGNRLDRERAVAADEGYWPTTSEEESSALHEVRRELESLPEPYREVLRLRYTEGLEIDEIARRLGRPRGTVGSQIKRGLDRLRERLGARKRGAREVPALAFLRRRSAYSLSSARFAAPATLAAACLFCLFLAFRSRGGPEPELRWRTAERGSRALGTEEAGLEAPSRRVGRTATDGRALEPSATTAVLDAQADRREALWLTSVRGIVVDIDGRPIANTAVRVGRQDEEEGHVATHTDAAGRFELDAVDGRLWLWAEDEERRPSFRHMLASVDPRCELILHSGEKMGASLGRVLSPDRQPVSGASVTMLAVGSPSVGEEGTLQLRRLRRALRTAADGTFPLAVSARGSCELVVFSDAWPPKRFVFGDRAAGNWHDFVLSRGGAVEGRALASDGRALAGLGLRLVLPVPLPSQDGITDGRGDFRFDHVPVGPYELVLAGPTLDGTSLHHTGLSREGESVRGEVRLAMSNTLRGVVLRAGRALEGWIVELERMRTKQFPDGRRQPTDARGKFEFPSCATGEKYIVRLWDPNGERLLWSDKVICGEVDELTLVPDESRGATCELRGTLKSQADRVPIFVELWNDTLSRRWMEPVDPVLGTYAFEGLPPGIFNLRAWIRGTGPVHLDRLELEPGTRQRFDVLPEPGRLQVFVDLPAGVDPSRLGVVVDSPSLQSSKPRGFQAMRSGASPFEFWADLPSGNHGYRVLIDGLVFEVHSVNIESALPVDQFVAVPPLVPVELCLRVPRVLKEREGFFGEAYGRCKRELLINRPTADEEYQTSVLLALDTTSLQVRTNLGLHGEWRGQLALGPEPPELWVTLQEPDPGPDR